MVCPVCIVGAWFGLVFLRTMGVSDLITGAWIGAAVAATVFYIHIRLVKKYGRWSRYQALLFMIVAMAVTTVLLALASPASTVCMGAP